MKGMESVEYTRMDAVEESMWWYHGLHANVKDALAKHAPQARDLLDAGCGTGGTLKTIATARPGMRLHGIDISRQACETTARKTGAQVRTGSIDALPYPDRSFDALISLDVLGYDLDVDAAVREFFRVLRPGGLAVVNLAAYQWMLSYHDKAVGQVRRYARGEAVALFRSHGFRVVRSTYWNTVLFPLMVLQRKLGGRNGTSDVRPFPAVVNNAFKTCLALERGWTRLGLALPFGGSVLLVAERPAT